MKRWLSTGSRIILYHLKPLALLCICLFIGFVKISLGQTPVVTWHKVFGSHAGDYAHDIRPTTDGGYIVAGYTDNKGGDVLEYHGNPNLGDLWVVKLNSIGDIQWQRSLGDIYMQTGADVRQTPDGGYIVAGSSVHVSCDGTTNYSLDYWLIKLNAKGEIQWEKAYGGTRNEYLYGLDLTAEGGFIVSGHSESNDGNVTGNHGDRDFWVVKVTADGTLQWQKSLGGSGVDAAYAVCTVADGGYVIAGYTESTNGDVNGMHGGRDYWVVKLSSTGSLQWQKALGGSGFEEAWSIQATPDGGCIMAGYTASNNGDVSGNHQSLGAFSDYWVVKLNASGALQWQKCYGGGFNEIGYYIQLTPDGGYVIAGSAESANGDLTCNDGITDMWVTKINNAGVLQWQKSLGGNYFDEASCVQPLADGSVIVAGYTCSSNVSGYHVTTTDNGTCADYWIVKLSAPVLSPPAPSVIISSGAVCAGAPTTLTAQALTAGINTTFQWKRQGIETGITGPTYTASNFTENETVTCTVTSGSPCDNTITTASASTTIKINKTVLAPLVTISANQTTLCSCAPVTFTATVSNGGSAPAYQWKVNDVYTDGSSATYAALLIKPNDVITCVYSDTSSCIVGGAVVSNPITIMAAAGQPLAVSITTPNGIGCSGSPLTFTATPVNAGATPAYQWQVNNVNAGSNSNQFTSSTLASGDVVTCAVTTDPLFTCTNASSATSNAITIAFSENVNPTVAIAASANPVCVGSSVTFTAMPANAGVYPAYEWWLNGTIVGTSNTFTNTTPVGGDSIYCTVIADPLYTCAASTRAASEVVYLTVTDPLSPAVTASVNKNSICSGTEVVFTAAAKEAGPFPAYQWFLNGSPATTGPVYRSAALHDGDAVYCRVTPAQSACPNHAAISDTIRAVVYPLPVLRIIPADTLISIGSRVHFTTVITGTVARYTWNPLPQLQAPVSLQPTTIALNDQTEFSLLVETEKGCKATAKAVVRIIKHLYMPNAFTPNGDGRNDHFRIPPGVKLKLELFSVYDRWGNRVFSTRAIEKGWNGTWKGMPLSTGNYVYVITGSDEKGMVLLKGNVLLVR